MKLELELQALSKVYQDMRRNEYTMTYLQNILNANHFPDEVWKGRGKDAYLSLEKNLQNEEKAKEYNKVLLVDDIYTTGSTIDACTRVLKAAGVKEVYFVCISAGVL